MPWNLSFITHDNLLTHVKETIGHYEGNLQSFDVRKFNHNIIDPIKLLFDKIIYSSSWDEIIKNELYRQRDKSNTNAIGYFHQKIFNYIDKCRSPENGAEGGWDIIYENSGGIPIEDESVYRIYVELKNKHNTMNSAASQQTYTKMQQMLLTDDSCACFLVEAIAKKSQNTRWKISIDSQPKQHKRIRRVSLDKFYALVTGVETAFYDLCTALPSIIEESVSTADVGIPNDTVYSELQSNSDNIMLSLYLLGFGTYNGFTPN